MARRRIGGTDPVGLRRIPLLLLAGLVGLLLLGVRDAHARSPHPPPLRRLHTPSSSTLEILPRHPNQASPLSPNYALTRPRSFRPPRPHPSSLRHSDSLLISLSLPSLLGYTHPVTLLLRPTQHLFHPDARVTFQSSGAGHSVPLVEEEYRLYTGEVVHPNWVERVRWEESMGVRGDGDARGVLGRASVMVHSPGEGVDGDRAVWEGSFTVGGVTYNVLTKEHYARVRTDADVALEEVGDGMVVFRDADMWHDGAEPSESHHCSHDSHPYNTNQSHPIWLARHSNLFTPLSAPTLLSDPVDVEHWWKRDDTGGMTGSSNYIGSINSTAGCPNTQQIVYMGVALDCNYVATYGSPDAARTQVLNDWNQISALYKSTFNISLGIVELVVQNMSCPASTVSGEEWNVECGRNLTLDERLSLFSQWRGNRADDGIGLWHLMSACPTDSEVGVAWLGTLCQADSNQQSGSYVSGTGISTAAKHEWALVSHEIGHGFGAIHDCTSGCSLSGSCCPYSQSSCDADGRFIMNPTTSSTESSFSGCTLGNICSNIGNRAISTTCIQSPSSRTVISLQQCGNGIVEDGEECDPGSGSNSTCCDASTCKFNTGAVCDPTNSACCTSSCQLASAGTVCRSAVNAICDYAETCTGTNATCPEDKTAEDGTSCGSNGLACASGVCTSLDLQCQQSGGDMNLTKACGQRDDTSCVVTCRSPGSSTSCVILQTPLVDGSPCGYGGHCYNQTCQAASWQDTAAAWYTQNLQISIPVTVVVGLIVLGILFALARCIVLRCCLGRPSRRQQRKLNQQQQRRQGNLRPPAPVMSQRHADSLSSQDPIVRTSLVDRDPSPAPPHAGPSSNPYAQGNGNGYGYGYGQHLDLPPQQQNGWQATHPAYAGAPGGYGAGGSGQQSTWVDERLYNGPNYGAHEAYGR